MGLMKTLSQSLSLVSAVAVRINHVIYDLNIPVYAAFQYEDKLSGAIRWNFSDSPGFVMASSEKASLATILRILSFLL